MKPDKPQTVDEYIEGFPGDVQVMLQQIRTVIKEAVPGVTEKIAYGLPTFVFHGNLISYAAWKKHIGMYPVPVALSEELKGYKQEKSSIHFALDKPIPLDLIKRIARYRAKEMVDNKRGITK